MAPGPAVWLPVGSQNGRNKMEACKTPPRWVGAGAVPPTSRVCAPHDPPSRSGTFLPSSEQGLAFHCFLSSETCAGGRGSRILIALTA